MAVRIHHIDGSSYPNVYLHTPTPMQPYHTRLFRRHFDHVVKPKYSKVSAEFQGGVPSGARQILVFAIRPGHSGKTEGARNFVRPPRGIEWRSWWHETAFLEIQLTMIDSRLQKVGIWIASECSFFLLFWDQRRVIFQLSGFCCKLTLTTKRTRACCTCGQLRISRSRPGYLGVSKNLGLLWTQTSRAIIVRTPKSEAPIFENSPLGGSRLPTHGQESPGSCTSWPGRSR